MSTPYQVPGLRPFTLDESARMVRLAVLIRHDLDAELGVLLLRVAGGDDSVMAAVHDRLHAIGRPELADRLRALVLGAREGGAA